MSFETDDDTFGALALLILLCRKPFDIDMWKVDHTVPKSSSLKINLFGTAEGVGRNGPTNFWPRLAYGSGGVVMVSNWLFLLCADLDTLLLNRSTGSVGVDTAMEPFRVVIRHTGKDFLPSEKSKERLLWNSTDDCRIPLLSTNHDRFLYLHSLLVVRVQRRKLFALPAGIAALAGTGWQWVERLFCPVAWKYVGNSEDICYRQIPLKVFQKIYYWSPHTEQECFFSYAALFIEWFLWLSIISRTAQIGETSFRQI